MKPVKPISNVRSQMRWGIVGVAFLFLASLVFVIPAQTNRAFDKVSQLTHVSIPHIPEKKFKLGLDLQSGVHLVYSTKLENIPEAERKAAVEGARDVIERRINALGVAEPNIQTTKVGDVYRINVELPGITDVAQATKLIGETPILEFKVQNTEPERELTAEETKTITEFNAAAKKNSDAALAALNKKTPFETVVTNFSTNTTTKQNVGYVGFVKKYDTNLDPAVYNFAKTAKEGEVTKKAIETDNGYLILKRGKEQPGEVELGASHILICYFGAPGCSTTSTKEAALLTAQSVYAEANASNFAALAKQYSTDRSNFDKGGDLGTFPKGKMIETFENALLGVKVGDIVGPVETQFGYHIIYKTAENTTTDYEVSEIFIGKLTEQDILPPAEPWIGTGLTGKQLKKAEVVTDPQTGSAQVSLQFDEEGSKLFEDITRAQVGKPIGIYLDGNELSAPMVDEAISGGQAVIRGQFTILEAKTLSQRLNAGALPVPVELVSQQTIGATLGLESLQKSLKAGLIGLVLVMIFMTLYYRLPGFIAVIALSLYVTLNLAIFKLLGVTLTLSGITGLILSIGMAVDANILIFERLKEELRSGKTLRQAVDEGFARAWTSIYDGNVATILAALLLFTMNASFVKGFAITLIIGTLVSMFTAITVTRILLQFVVPWFKKPHSPLFLGSVPNKE